MADNPIEEKERIEVALLLCSISSRIEWTRLLMDFKFGDTVNPLAATRVEIPSIDFDFDEPATLEDDPAMQSVLESLRQSSTIAEQSLDVAKAALEVSRSSRNVARASLIVSFVSLIVAFISFAAAYNLW